MTAEIPNLWGREVEVDVLPPLAVLRTQAENISVLTKGLLRGHVWLAPRDPNAGDPREGYVFDLEAPALQYAEEVLNVEHPVGRGYPATILLGVDIQWPTLGGRPPVVAKRIDCADEEEFLLALGTALQSPPVRALLRDLLARTKERPRSRAAAS